MRSLPTSELLSSPAMTLALRASVMISCLLAACAGSEPRPSSPDTLEPSEYFPLHAGNAWSYDVDTGDVSTTLGVTRVEASDGHFAEVRTGRASVRYETLAEGIRVPPGDAWLLRGPLKEGASWPARGGRTARLLSMDTRIETRAGRFERCIEVAETGGELELEIRIVYCPGVGPVALDSTMRSKTSERVVTVVARLRGYEVSRESRSER
jgi:hypothetical protein